MMTTINRLIPRTTGFVLDRDFVVSMGFVCSSDFSRAGEDGLTILDVDGIDFVDAQCSAFEATLEQTYMAATGALEEF